VSGPWSVARLADVFCALEPAAIVKTLPPETPPNAPASTLTFPVQYAPGHVSSISPNLPKTPRFLQKGDTVTLEGLRRAARHRQRAVSEADGERNV